MFRILSATIVTLALLSSLVPPLQAAAANARPNILWIIGEDLGPELACYGETLVNTPHLDQLAASGARFSNAFTTTPVCSTSRSSFMTGMYSTTIGTHNHRSHRNDGYQLPAGIRVLTDWLRESGYFTANIVHFPGEDTLEGTGKTDWNFHYEGQPFDSKQWSDLKSQQPFFAQVNFPETHRGKQWDRAHEVLESPVNPDDVKLPPYYPDHAVARRDWAQYLNTVMALDIKVGKVLRHLEQDGLADNTIVIFFGDHGRAHVRGKQWCYDSGLHVPLIIRWPRNSLIANLPPAGSTVDSLVSMIDISASTLAMAGIPKPARMQGRNLFGPDAESPRQYVFGTRDRCDETVFRIRTVRDSRYRYMRNFMPQRPFLQTNRYKLHAYPTLRLMQKLYTEKKLNGPSAALFTEKRQAEELYDLRNDPHEIQNLVHSPDHSEDLTRLRKVLVQWIEETGDMGYLAESEDVLKAAEAQMREHYDSDLRTQQLYEKQHGIQITTEHK